jgi:hypothetical protein
MQVLLPNFTEQKAILRMILTEAGVINIWLRTFLLLNNGHVLELERFVIFEEVWGVVASLFIKVVLNSALGWLQPFSYLFFVKGESRLLLWLTLTLVQDEIFASVLVGLITTSTELRKVEESGFVLG